MKAIEIRVVSNGYWVGPAFSQYATVPDPKDITVFQTFEALINWMEKELKLETCEK